MTTPHTSQSSDIDLNQTLSPSGVIPAKVYLQQLIDNPGRLAGIFTHKRGGFILAESAEFLQKAVNTTAVLNENQQEIVRSFLNNREGEKGNGVKLVELATYVNSCRG